MTADAFALRVAEAMVLGGAVRDPKTLPSFARAAAAAQTLTEPGFAFHARLVAAGQVSSAMWLVNALTDRETIRGTLTIVEDRARAALDAWAEDFFATRRGSPAESD